MYLVTEHLLISSMAGLEYREQNTGYVFPVRPEKKLEKCGSFRESALQEAAEIADALDRYKLIHRRRFISFEEMIEILRSLGYRRY